MINKPEPTLLEQLDSAGVGIDVDDCDPELVKAVGELVTVQDVTSNQFIIHAQLMSPANKDVVEETIREMKGQGYLAVHTTLTARFHKKLMNMIAGRVLAQVSPSQAYNKDAILRHARAYRDAYNAEGISNDRFCIKIPTTTAGVQAAAILYKEDNIRTLGTALFGLPQALAAQQANMLSISPYYNEVRAHKEADLWPDVEDPATQHPMSARMIHIRDAYAKLKAEGKTVPLNKAASFISAREAMAMAELGADQATILAGCLDDLMATSRLPAFKKGSHQKRIRADIDDPNLAYVSWSLPEASASKKRMQDLAKTDPLSKVFNKDAQIASFDADYLADGVLDKMNEEDELTKIRLRDALELFINAEKESQDEIERLQKVYK